MNRHPTYRIVVGVLALAVVLVGLGVFLNGRNRRGPATAPKVGVSATPSPRTPPHGPSPSSRVDGGTVVVVVPTPVPGDRTAPSSSSAPSRRPTTRPTPTRTPTTPPPTPCPVPPLPIVGCPVQ